MMMATVGLRLLTGASAMAGRAPPAVYGVARARPFVCNAPSLPDHIEDMLEELASGEAQVRQRRAVLSEWRYGVRRP